MAAWLLAACGGPPSGAQATGPKNDPLDDVAPRELYETGAVLAQQGDLVRAEQYLEASIERGYPEDEALPLLVEVCVRASRLRAALEHAVPYLRRHPRDWRLRMLVATIQMALSEWSSARVHLEKVTGQVPAEAPAHYLLGVVEDETGDVVASIPHFRRYLELAPEGEHAEEVRAILATRATTVVPVAPSPTSAAPAAEKEAEADAAAGADTRGEAERGGDPQPVASDDGGNP